MGVPAAKFKQKIYDLAPPSSQFLHSERYINWLAKTHPSLNLKTDFGLPTYEAPLGFFEPLKPGRLRRAFRFAALKWPRLFAPKALFVGSPFEPYEQILNEKSQTPEFISRLRGSALECGCGLVVVTNVSKKNSNLDAWRAQGFKVLPSFPDMVLSLPGDHFDDYLAMLKSKERNSILRNLRRFEQSRLTIRRMKGDALRLLAHQMIQGYHHLYVRAGVKWLRHTAAYFESLSSFEDDIFVDVAFGSNHRLVGFIVSYNDGERLHGGRIGIMPSHHQKDAVYFRLIYQLIQRGYALKKKEVVLEPTSFKFKRYLGAQYRPLVNLVSGVNPFWSLVCRAGYRLGRWWLNHLTQARQLEKYY